MFRSKYIMRSLAAIMVLATPAAASAQANDDMGVELLQLLVDEGVIPYDKAQELLNRARQKAEERKQRDAQNATSQPINVSYVPETVRAQIKEEVKAEVMASAKQEGLVAPGVLPKWMDGLELTGDFRARYQYENFDKDNFPFFPDLNQIISDGGAPLKLPPSMNSTQDRGRMRYHALLGVNAQISKQVKFGLRLGSGDAPGIVSTNRTLGDFFAHDGVYIDRAYVELRPVDQVALVAGRMPNPFYSTDMMWDGDVNPEGAVLVANHKIGPARLFATGGYFPMQERELYSDRFMVGGQVGVDAELESGLSFKLAGAYYDFERMQSKKNTVNSRLNDYTAPVYLSRGNSIFNIRNDGLTSLPGLASEYDILAVTGSVGYRTPDIAIGVTGEYIQNLAFDANEIKALRVEPGVEPGDKGWQVRLDVGSELPGRRLTNPGDWRLAAAYKHLETDAVLDILTDSDFGLGGTNVKGYLLEGEYAVFRNTTLGLRWLSTNQIAGAPYAVDVLQVHVRTGF